MNDQLYVNPIIGEAAENPAATTAYQKLQGKLTQDQPRERLLNLGPAALSDRELISILLNTGIKGKNVHTLAEEVLDRLERDEGIPTVTDLANLAGIGYAKASAIIAALEVGRRRWGIAGTRIKSPQDIYSTVRHFADRRQERFISISLNGAHEIIAVRVVTIGLVNRTIVHPREVFADPLADRASAICVAHNHPSGQVQPSSEDDDVTQRLKDAAAVLGIHLLDHLIFSPTKYFSYLASGRMEEP